MIESGKRRIIFQNGEPAFIKRLTGRGTETQLMENIKKLKGGTIMKKMTILTVALLLGFFIGVFSANVEIASAAPIDPEYIDGDVRADLENLDKSEGGLK